MVQSKHGAVHEGISLMTELRQKTLAGITWSITSQAGKQVIALIIGIILARLLSPREFGLIAMITVMTGFAAIFAELGLSAALIQKQDVRQDHLSSVFWINLIGGLLLMLIFIVGAPLIAGFYHEPTLIPLTMLISTNFLIGSLNIVQKTLITKSLDFRTVAIAEISAIAVSGILAILLAYSGFGVWSLAIQSVVCSIVTAMLLWKLNTWRPKFTFNGRAVKELLGFSANLLGTQSLNYWVRNLDNLLIGRFLGTVALGGYSWAYSIMLFPQTNISSVISRVMFPSFSMIQKEKERIKSIYLSVTRVIALVTFPMMCGLFVTVVPFVMAVFGPQWAGMIPILQVFCVVGLIQSIGTLNGNLYLSQGRADLQFKIGLILRTNAILGIIVGLHWGVVGVALGYATASFINSYPNLFFAGRLINLTYSELMKNLADVFACSATMAAAVWSLGLLLPTDWPHWAYLAVQVPFGIAIYTGLVHFFDLKAYRELQGLLVEQWQQGYFGSLAHGGPK
jgi:O-antigen/teichoic acid export membrane protein